MNTVFVPSNVVFNLRLKFEIVYSQRNLLIFLLFFCFFSVFSQKKNNNPGGLNNASELSDKEVENYWDQAQSQGYKLEDIPELAESQGFTPEEVDDLVRRIQLLEGNNNKRGRKGRGKGNKALLSIPEISEIEEEPESNIFGMAIFSGAVNTGFSPNLNMATPKSYILGPGDKISAQVYGATQATYRLKVSPQGSVNIPIVGPINVSGLSIDAATGLVKNRLSAIYGGITGPNPSIFLDIVLDEIRTIQIHVVGELQRPGSYEVPAYASSFNVIYVAGGPNENGTFRDVELYRAGNLISTIDLYDFLIYGKDLNDQNLEDGDILLVKPYSKRINVRGAVRRQDFFYEINGDETIGKLISWAGGLSPDASRNSLLHERYNGAEQFVKDLPFDMTMIHDFEDGDRLSVRKEKDLLVDRVQVNGAVAVPGIYEWQEGLTLGALIERAGNLIPSAFLSNGTVFRFNEDLSSTAFQVNLSEDADILLKSGDVVRISENFEVSQTQFVQVSGEVNGSGVFPFYEGITAGDMLLLAGGLKHSALKGKIEIARRTEKDGIPSIDVISLQTPNTSEELFTLNFKLKALDHVFVRAAAGYQPEAIVSIFGEVNHPGNYVLTSGNMKVRELLERAGGFNSYAFVDGIALIRASEPQSTDDLEDEEIELLTALKRKMADTDDIYKNSNNENLRNALDLRIKTLKNKVKDRKAANKSKRNGRESNDRIGLDIQEILQNPDSPHNLVLLPGDIIDVPRKQDIVKIRGQVLYPTSTKFLDSENFKSYISNAGGYSRNAKPGLSYVIYANGDAARVKRFLFFRNYPEIKPGSEIVIPGGKLRQVFSPERLLGLASSLLTTYFLIDRISN